jgi:cell division septation protein DedD
MSGQATPLLPDDLAVNAEFITLSREFDPRVVADTFSLALDDQMVSGTERLNTTAQTADLVVTDAVASKVNGTVNASGSLRRRVGTAVAGFAATTASLLIGGNVAKADSTDNATTASILVGGNVARLDHPPHDPNNPPCDTGFSPYYPSWDDSNNNGLVGNGEVSCRPDAPPSTIATTTTVKPTPTTVKPTPTTVKPTPTTVKPTPTTVKPTPTTATPTTLAAVAESTPTSIEGTSTSSTDISTSTSLDGTTSSEADESTSSSSLPNTSTTDMISGAGSSVDKSTGWFNRNMNLLIPGAALLLISGGVLIYIRLGKDDETETDELQIAGVNTAPTSSVPPKIYGSSGATLPPAGGKNLGFNQRSRTELN